jgi:hypothetical protein
VWVEGDGVEEVFFVGDVDVGWHGVTSLLVVGYCRLDVEGHTA